MVDLLTFVLVLRARNTIAAKQFLKGLTQHVGPADYPKLVLTKAVALVPDVEHWLVGLY